MQMSVFMKGLKEFHQKLFESFAHSVPAANMQSQINNCESLLESKAFYKWSYIISYFFYAVINIMTAKPSSKYRPKKTDADLL